MFPFWTCFDPKIIMYLLLALCVVFSKSPHIFTLYLLMPYTLYVTAASCFQFILPWSPTQNSINGILCAWKSNCAKSNEWIRFWKVIFLASTYFKDYSIYWWQSMCYQCGSNSSADKICTDAIWLTTTTSTHHNAAICWLIIYYGVVCLWRFNASSN